MQPSPPLEYAPWTAMFLVLTVGVASVVGLTALAGRFVRSAAWQRTVWQVCTLALLALVLVEWTGTGRGLVYSFTAGLRVQSANEPESPHPCATAVPAALDDADAFSNPSPEAIPGNDPFSAGMTATQATSMAAVETPAVARTAETAAAQSPSDARTAGTAVAHETSPVAPTIPWWPAAIWALGSGVLFVRVLWAGLRLRAFRRGAVPAGEAVQRRVGAISGRLGFRRPVRVLVADGLRVPVAFGVFRPTLVLPAVFDAEFDPPQQEAVLAHELAHLAAGDPVWHLLATLACALLWWHPAAWWSRRQLRAASETAADEVSLVVQDGPRVLAECLVALGRRLARRPQLGWLSVEGNGFRSGLGRRVERLLQLRMRPWQSPRRGRTILARCVLPVSLVFVAVSCTAWAQPQVPFPEGGTTMSVLKSSWRCSLAATALWAMLGPAQVSVAEDEGPRDRPKAAAERGDRKEGDAREGARPRKDGDNREVARPRKEGDDREGARREGDRPRPEAREGEGRARPSPEAVAQQRKHLEEMARDLRAKLEKLQPNQEAEAREIKQKLERIGNALRDAQGPRPERPNAQIAERLEQMKRHIAELKAAGKHDEAERVAREAREMMQRLQGARDGDKKRPDAAVQERLEQMKRRAAELKEAGKHDEAARLIQEIKQIAQRLEGARDGDKKRPDAAAQERLEQLKRRMAELKAAGKNDEAARLGEEFKQLSQRLQGAKEGARDGDKKRPAPEVMERLEQMKRRAAELKAAGKYDEAARLSQEIKDISQRLQGARDGDKKRPDGDKKRPDKEAPRAGAQNPEVQALRNEVQQMRRDMQEMREMMKKLMERERK